MSLHDVSLSSLGSCIVSILIDVITNASDGSILRQIKKPKFVNHNSVNSRQIVILEILEICNSIHLAFKEFLMFLYANRKKEKKLQSEMWS